MDYSGKALLPNHTACVLHADELDTEVALPAQDQTQSWLRPSSWTHTKRPGPGTCILRPRAVWSTGAPRCECTLPAPGCLQRDYPRPWRRVDKALFMEIPTGASPPVHGIAEHLRNCSEYWAGTVLTALAIWLCSGPDTLQRHVDKHLTRWSASTPAKHLVTIACMQPQLPAHVAIWLWFSPWQGACTLCRHRRISAHPLSLGLDMGMDGKPHPEHSLNAVELWVRLPATSLMPAGGVAVQSRTTVCHMEVDGTQGRVQVTCNPSTCMPPGNQAGGCKSDNCMGEPWSSCCGAQTSTYLLYSRIASAIWPETYLTALLTARLT